MPVIGDLKLANVIFLLEIGCVGLSVVDSAVCTARRVARGVLCTTMLSTSEKKVRLWKSPL